MSLYQFMTPIKRKKPADENQDPLQSSKKAKPGDSVSKRKQACAYRHEWAQGRETWLYYRQDEGMYCKLCQKYNKRPFDRDTWNKTPCRRLRLGSVKEHEQSAGHLDALKLELLSTTSHNIAEVIQPEVGHDAIVSAFKCLYFLAKRRIPHVANFEPLLDLLTQLGLTVKDDLHVAKNATYCSDHSVREMLHFLSSTMEDDTIQRVQKSDFFSIMLDETTDVSVEEQLTLNCRFLDESGQLSVKFLKIIQPLNLKSNDEPNHLPTVSLNAETIARHVTSYFAEYGLNFDNLVGIGTDGAAVMTGNTMVS
ncbi:protein FAM200B-like [Ptychodera flava]|uniref:protein FAM200B-like n=1 Tax=Ptychodera flava TaxID=63121 RepID=UPI00396A6778